MNKDTLKFDVVIVGAGIAGSALTCALGDDTLKVALVEAQPISQQWPEQGESIDGFDARVSALTKASQAFLADLDVWSRIADCRVSAYKKMHVWDGEGTAAIDFSAQEINQSELGHIVENRVTVAALMSRIHEMDNVHLFDGCKVQCLDEPDDEQPGDSHLLHLDDGRLLKAALIVAADGANSQIRSQAHFDTREWNYGHHAIVATVQTALPHQNTAWQRFMTTGPLAFLPLQSDNQSQHLCSIVWSAIPQYADNLMALTDQEFTQALAQAFEFQLGEIVATSRRFRFSLRQRHATNYVKPGIALVGDAAHTIHPLAGQGINLGLKDVQVLAQEILRAHERGLDCGSLPVLNRFQRRRKGGNLAMMATMEGFKRLFEQPALPVRWIRNTGMRWLNNSQLLKHRLMREAMGL